MARYAKVDRRIWNDARFRSLSERGKLVFLFLLTHPNLTMLGAMRASVAGLAAELEMPVEGFREAFTETSSKGLARHDSRASFLWLPNFLKYNKPESPNVVKAWPDAFDLIPECRIKHELFEQLKVFVKGLSKTFGQAFAEAFPNDYVKDYGESVTVTKEKPSSESCASDQLPGIVVCEVDPLEDLLVDGFRESVPKAMPDECQSDAGTIPEEAIFADMAWRAVMDRCRLAYHPGLGVVLDRLARLAEEAGEDMEDWVEEAVKAYTDYQVAVPHLEITFVAEKFFGEGLWRNRDGWRWRDGYGPPPKEREGRKYDRIEDKLAISIQREVA